MNGITLASNSRFTAPTAPTAPSPVGGRHGKVKNITRRKGVWYFKKTVGTKRYFQSLNTKDQAIASARAKILAAAAVGEKWEVLDGVKSKRTVCTVAELLEIWETAWPTHDIKENTANGYKNALLNMLRQVHGPMKDNAYSTELLTSELVLKFQDAMLLAAGTDEARRESRQRSVSSTVTNARAIFSSWTERHYKEIKLPDLKGFLSAALNRKKVKSYRLPPQALIDTTLTEGRALKTEHPRRYTVFLLCYDLGLRAGEAANCQWSWFTGTKGARQIEILRRPDFQPKWGKERRIPVSEQVWQHLQACKAADAGAYVLPGHKTDRDDLVMRDFAGWMRSIGWHASEYEKAAHELRKLIGSRWYTELGAEVAQAWLGHENVSTTCTYYTALRKQPRPLAMDFTS